MAVNDNPYGDQPGHSRKRRSAPRSLSDALDGLQGNVIPPTLLARVQEQWATAAGAQVAAQARPVAESNGQVTISCSSSVWSAELNMMASALLARLNECLSKGPQVVSLRFVAGGPSSGS